MDGEDEIDRMLAELIGPGIDRDWLADARSVSSELHNTYRLPTLDETALEVLASGLGGIELCSRPNLQTPPLDKSHEQDTLQEVAALAGRLRDLLAVDTPFGQRFYTASESAAIECPLAKRHVTWRMAPMPMPQSPIPSLHADLSFVEIVANAERKRLKSAPQRRRGTQRKTEVMGRDLPALYAEVYPRAPIGSHSHYRNQTVDGPRHRFVQMCAEFLGYPQEEMANIEKMARVMKNAKSASDG